MQKLIKRTRQAETQVARRIKKSDWYEFRHHLRERREHQKSAVKEANQNLSIARRLRHESWERGPLATNFGSLPFYGSLKENYRTQGHTGTESLRPHELASRCAWAGGAKHPNLVPGDRVILVDGPHKGKIDEIDEVDFTQDGTVKLKHYHKAVLRLPDFVIQLSENNSRTAEVETTCKVPISAIRLVHPLTDPATNTTRDVIIRNLVAANIRHDRATKTTEWDRVVPGRNVIIPWPKKEAPPDATAGPDDTHADEVYEHTFIPTLLSPPMPETVIHELRNRFSRFRTRHEDWYVEKKEAAEEARTGRARQRVTMRTPLEEFNRQQRKMRRAIGQPVLTDEMLENIGRVIAKNKQRMLASAGMTEVSSGSKDVDLAALGATADKESRASPP